MNGLFMSHVAARDLPDSKGFGKMSLTKHAGASLLHVHNKASLKTVSQSFNLLHYIHRMPSTKLYSSLAPPLSALSTLRVYFGLLFPGLPVS